MRMLLCAVVAATAAMGAPYAAPTRGETGYSLITQLEHEHPEGGLSMHRQTYGETRWDRRALQTQEAELTTENTRPIQLHLDFNSLDEATAPEYSACFAVGAWFRRGFPQPESTCTRADKLCPPANGIETCVRGAPAELSSAGQDCWGRCRDTDVITPQIKSTIAAVITKIVRESVQPLLRVQPVQGALTFDDDEGVHQRAVISKGYSTYRACAVDCTVLNRVAVDPSYCSAGIAGADAVLSITMPPPVAGVAGTGAYCVADQNRRPIWLVFEWMRTLSDLVGLSNIDQQV